MFATGKNQGLDIESIRAEFPMLKQRLNGKPYIYLGSAATSYKPQLMIDKLIELYTSKFGKPDENHSMSKLMTEKMEETRSKVAKLINARDSKEVVFVKSCTEAINLVANGFGKALLKPNDEVLITVLEGECLLHYLPLRHMQRRVRLYFSFFGVCFFIYCV